ncbi:unnamed protein product [Leptidea sinapis]|uniref:Uncharacterized protein n=1 Tax=Leptidea sinapis TaxID=189913 RepID=A0A5E4PVL8_9NEOP|nr:unnamed protein product [Leptidea sinapis]
MVNARLWIWFWSGLLAGGKVAAGLKVGCDELGATPQGTSTNKYATGNLLADTPTSFPYTSRS